MQRVFGCLRLCMPPAYASGEVTCLDGMEHIKWRHMVCYDDDFFGAVFSAAERLRSDIWMLYDGRESLVSTMREEDARIYIVFNAYMQSATEQCASRGLQNLGHRLHACVMYG